MITALLLSAMTGCDFSASVGSGPAASDYAAAVTAANGANPATTAFRVTGATGTISTEEDQTITINFTGGVVDSDSAATAITIYPLTDGADANSAYARGTALSLTSTVYQTGAAASDVVYVLDGTTIATNGLEIVIDSTLTANNGSITFNQDQDGIAGEAEDDQIRYVAVTQTANAPAGFTTITTGVMRNPRNSFSYNTTGIGYVDAATVTTDFDFSAGGIIDDTAIPSALYLQFDVGGVAPTTDTYNTALTPTAEVLKLQQLVDGQWTDVNSTIALASTVNSVTQYATYSVTPGTAFAIGGVYRFAVNDFWESAAVNGYSLFYDGTTDQNTNGWTYWGAFTFEDSSAAVAAYAINNGTTLAVVERGNLGAGTAFIEVTIGGAVDLKSTSVAAEDFIVRLTNPDNDDPVVTTDYTDVSIGTVSLKAGTANTFILPVAAQYAENGDYEIILKAGSVIDEGADDTTPNDDALMFGGVGNDFNVVTTGTFTL